MGFESQNKVLTIPIAAATVLPISSQTDKLMKAIYAIRNLISLILVLVVVIIIGCEQKG